MEENQVLQRLLSKAKDPYPTYVRSRSNESESLEKKLGQVLPLDAAKTSHSLCTVLPSGTSAIESTLVALLLMIRHHQHDPNPRSKKGISQTHLFHLGRGQMFSGTLTTLRFLDQLKLHDSRFEFQLPPAGPEAKGMGDLRQILSDEFSRRVRPQDTVVYFLEACTNPTGLIPPWSLFRDPQFKRQCHRIFLIVDNTWMTHELFNPFLPPCSADLVISSLTKYYTGGTAIAGALWYPSRLEHLFRDYIRPRGLHVSPQICRVIETQVISLRSRLEHSSRLTLQVLHFLHHTPGLMASDASKNQGPVLRIYHPSLPLTGTPSDIEKMNCLVPSVIAMDVNMNRKQAFAWMASSGFQMATSFGALHTRFDTFPVEIEPNTLPHITRVRLALGFSDTLDFVLAGLSKLATPN